MDVFDLFAKISLDTKEYDSGLSKAEGKLSKFGGAVGSAFGTIAKIGGVALTAATGATVAFGASAVEAGKDFDSSMSQVAATMGKTVGEIKDLRDFAQEMGRTTAFSATQAADALNYMALAGYTADESMTMLPNVLNLAAAGNIDLARASDMVTDAQTAFGIEADRVTQMVDEMAKAASTGNTSVEQLGDAFLTVGGLAQELNGGVVTLADGTTQSVDGIQELEIALTAMANAGIKGSEAGTHMRNMLLKLSSPTSDGAKQLENLGVKIFDASGDMRSMRDIMGDLSGALGNLTQEQKIKAISDLFNTRDLASAEALLNAVGQDWDEIGASILDAEGAASTMAATQLDNLAGDITLFQSALEGAKIAVSDKLTPALRNFVKFGTKGLSDLTDAFSKDGLSGAMSVFKDLIAEAASGLAEALPEMVEAGIGLLTALVEGLIEAAPELQKAGERIINTLLENIGSAMGLEGPVSALDIIQTFSQFISDNLPEMMKAGADALSEFLTGISDDIPKVLDSAVEILGALCEGIAQSLPTLIPTALDVILEFVEGLLDNTDEVVDAAIRIFEGLIGGIVNSIPKLVQKAPTIIIKFVAALLKLVPQMVRVGVDLLVGLIAGIAKTISAVVDKIKEVGKKIVDAFKSFFGIHSPSKVFEDFGKNLIQGLIDGVKNMVSKVSEAIKELGEKIGGGFEDVVKDAGTWASDLISNFTKGLTNGVGKVGEAVKKIAEKIKSLLGFSEPEDGPLSNFHTYAPDMMDLFIQGIKDSEDELQKQISKTFDIGELIVKNETDSDKKRGNVFNAGGVTVNIYPKDTALANEIVDEIQWRINKNINTRRAVWGM